jgi:hypothetical protein
MLLWLPILGKVGGEQPTIMQESLSVYCQVREASGTRECVVSMQLMCPLALTHHTDRSQSLPCDSSVEICVHLLVETSYSLFCHLSMESFRICVIRFDTSPA